MDWGLGHATRCIPVIKELQRQGVDVRIASSGSAGILLCNEFPGLHYLELPGYSPRYPEQGSMMLSLMKQLPKFINTIRKEHQAVVEWVAEHHIDAVISDNRYGCYSEKVKSVFITHQINVSLPEQWAMLASTANSFLHTYIRRFQDVWVPDQPGSGLTERFMSTRIEFNYIGWLSRFCPHQFHEKKYDVMAIASGPEPQRTLFESLLRQQLHQFPGRALVVAGKPGEVTRMTEGSMEIFSHLDGVAMAEAIGSSEVIISRSGYSTIMDLIAMGKKAAFVPTPQQPEQIGLAEVLMRNGIAFCLDQHNFVLTAAVKGALESKGLGSYEKQEGLLERQIKILVT